MGNTQLYLLSLVVALFFIAIYAEPLPESEPEGAPEVEPEGTPEAGANAQPENAASLAQGHMLTALVSFFAYILFK